MLIEDELERERQYIETSKKYQATKNKSEFDNLFKIAKKQKKIEGKKEMEQREREEREKKFKNVSSFNHPEHPEFRTGAWECDWRGVRMDSYNGELWACKHPIMPTEVLRNIQTSKEKLRLAYERRGVWSTCREIFSL